MYNITQYSYNKAKQLGVVIQPSKRKYKKIDVYKKGEYICSIGDNRFSDYPTYMITHGKTYANERRRLYNIRHSKEKDKIGTAGFFALKILW
jgi:hypothetical protein